MNKYIIVICVLIEFIFSQDYSNDSLIVAHNCNAWQKISIKMIDKWQDFSYKSNSFNCQFYPSCSNYCALAISKEGLMPGIVIGLDRILRCNPTAVGHHFRKSNPQFYHDDRIIDKLKLDVKAESDQSAVLLSIIPGLGKLYLGHKFDGILSFSLTSLLYISSRSALSADKAGIGLISGGLCLLFWASDIYGTYRINSSLQYKKSLEK